MAAALTWTSGAGTTNIYDAGNWSPVQLPIAGDTLTFSGITGLAPSLGSNLTLGSIIFDTAAGTFTINGGATFTINSAGIANNGTKAQTFNTAISLNAAQTWASNSGSLIFNGNISNNSNYLLTISGAGNTTFNGNLSGSGGLTKSSTGTLTLNGANTYTGATTLSGGTVQIGNNSAFGTGIVNFNSTTLKLEAFGGDRTISNNLSLTASPIFQAENALTFTGNATLTGNRTLTTNGTGLVSLTGNVSGSYRLTKRGAGTLFLSGNNSFTGGYRSNAGTSIVSSNTALGTGLLYLGTSTFQAGSSSITLANTFLISGNTILGGSQNITFNGDGSLNGSRTQTFNGSGTVTYNGVLSGAATSTYNKKGPGTVIFGGTAANTYLGLTYVFDGRLILAKSSVNAFAGNLRIGDNSGAANSAIVQLNAANQIPDASTLTIYSDGQLNLQSFSETVAATTFYGGSVVGSGTLGLNGNLAFSGTGSAQATIESNLSLNGDRTFLINPNSDGSRELTINGAITNGSGTSSIIKTGSGTLALNGSNTFSGGLSVNAGTVIIGTSSTGSITSGPLGTGGLNLGDTSGAVNASLLFANVNGKTVANSLTVRSGSTGILTLGGLNTSGTNTFSGPIILTRNLSLSAEAGGTINLDGPISGAGSINKIGAGTVSLHSANTSSGATSITAGVLSLGVNNALSSGTLTIDSGILDFGVNHLATTGTVSLVSGDIIGSGTLTSTGNFALSNGSISVALAGSGTLTKSTLATVTLSGASTYSGATTISAGILELARINALASSNIISISSGAILDLLGNNNQIGSLSGAGNVTLGSALLTTGNSTSTAFSGIISGSGGLTKNGTGTFTLSTLNTYSGPTSVAAGTLRLGIANAINSASPVTLASGGILDLNNFNLTLGSLSGAGNLTQGSGALTVGGDNSSTTLSGVISGSGTFNKIGSGNFTLTGNNTTSGAVDLSSGKIALSGANGALGSISSLTIRSGSTIDLDNSSVENNNRIANAAAINLRGGTFNFSSDNNGTTEILGALNVASGSSTVQINHNGSSSNATILTFSSLGPVTNGATVNFLSTGGILGDSNLGPQIYLTGQTSGTILNWATVGGDAAEYFTFGIRAFSQYYEGSLGVSINDTTKLVRLSSTSPSGASTLTRPGLTTDLGLNLTDIATVDLGSSAANSLNLLNGTLIKSTATTTTIGGLGTLTAGGSSAGNLNISITSDSALTISSVITDNAGSGSVGLIKSDLGTLTLSGLNTFTGNVFLNQGILNITSEANLGAVGNDVTFNGGSLHIGNSFTSNAGKTFTVTNALTGTLDIASGQTLTLANVSGILITTNSTSTLVKSGSGALIVTNANAAFDGALRISSGTVEIQHAQSLGDATNRGVVFLDGGALALRNNLSTSFLNNLTVTADSTISVDRLSGSGAVIHTLGNFNLGAQILTLSSSNSSSLSLGNINLTGAGTLNPTTADLTVGAISGNFALTKTGAATLRLSAASSYTGATNLNSGTLRLGIANALPSSTALILAPGSTFDLANFSATTASLSGSGSVTLGSGTLSTGTSSSTYSGIISGTGGLTKIGVGTTTLSGISTYTGTTTISDGTLALSGVNLLNPATAVSIASGAILNLLNNNTQIASLTGAGNITLGSATITTGSNYSNYSGAISGTGGLVKTGSGTTTLSGASTYTGPTNITSGIIVARSNGAIGTAAGSVTISANAELQLENNISLPAKSLTTSGTLRNNSGSNTYAGSITQATDSTLSSNSGTLTASGSVVLSGKNLTVTGAGDTVISGAITGGGASQITKSGTGKVTLSGSNTYTGSTTIISGTLEVTSNSALGATGAGNNTTVTSGATLLINQTGGGVDVGLETLSLSGTGVGGNGALRSQAGDNSWAGNILLAVDSTLRVDADSFEIIGNLSETGGPCSLTKTGSGVLILTGITSNTGPINLTTGSILLGTDDRFGDSAAVNISSGATFNLDDNDETIGSLSGAGTVETGSSGGNTFTIGANNASTTYSGTIQGAGDFQKTGSGTTTISGTPTYSGGTTISAGILNLTGTANGISGIVITNGGTLTGTGSTNKSVTVEAGGILSAGLTGAGQLSTGNINLNSGSTLLVEMGGTANAAHDIIDVTGTVTLGGNLSISLINGYTPDYTLLNLYGFNATGNNPNLTKTFILFNDGPDSITGTFANATSTPGYFVGASSVTLAGLQYAISYQADSISGNWVGGNDIAFIAIPESNPLPSILLGAALLSGLQLTRKKIRRS